MNQSLKLTSQESAVHTDYIEKKIGETRSKNGKEIIEQTSKEANQQEDVAQSDKEIW